jgi:hypothetical protein
MRNKILATFILCLILFLSLSCEKEKEYPAKFTFKVLNEQGEATSIFAKNDNVIFSFSIENTSNEDLYFKHYKMDLSDFCRLYKTDNNPELDLGTPWEHLFCDMIGGQIVPANGIFKIEIPWIYTEGQNYGYLGCPQESYHSQTNTLDLGTYKSRFSSDFEFGNFTTNRMTFEVNFTVK